MRTLITILFLLIGTTANAQNNVWVGGGYNNGAVINIGTQVNDITGIQLGIITKDFSNNSVSAGGIDFINRISLSEPVDLTIGVGYYVNREAQDVIYKCGSILNPCEALNKPYYLQSNFSYSVGFNFNRRTSDTSTLKSWGFNVHNINGLTFNVNFNL